MFPSCEIRWFFKGGIPLKILNWFQSIDKNCQVQTPRVDQYIKLPDEGALGIKLREGRIEIKKRKGTPKILTVNRSVEGYIEFWNKWGFELKDQNVLPIPGNGNGEWIPVRKGRSLFLFEVADAKCFVRNRQNGQLKNGCIVELTDVAVDDRHYWTLGIEAFGENEKMEENLIVTTSRIFSGNHNPDFLNRDSMSYPAWISRNLTS